MLKLKRCLTFLDIYNVNFNKNFSKFLKDKSMFKYQRKLLRYLRVFHFMYYLKLKKIFAFEKSTIKQNLYSNALIKVLKKNIFLLY